MKVEYHHELPNFDHRLAPVVLAGTIIGDRLAIRSAGMRPGKAGHQTPIREFSIGTIRENSSGTDNHSRTKTKSPQTNGICERFHKTMLDEFYRVAFRKKLYRSTAELQADLDAWLRQYNEFRTHQGRWCYGKTPMQTFLDSLPVAREKLIDQQSQAMPAAC
jgi:hypothetical protein